MDPLGAAADVVLAWLQTGPPDGECWALDDGQVMARQVVEGYLRERAEGAVPGRSAARRLLAEFEYSLRVAAADRVTGIAVEERLDD